MLPPFPVIFTSPFLPQARALFDRFAVQPTFERKVLINTLINSLLLAGVWQQLDYLHIYASFDSQAARQNWIGDYANATAVNSPTFTADRGYQGNGSSSYLNTNYNPGDGGTYKLTQNSAVQGVWSRTNVEETAFDIGARTSGALALSCFLSRVASNTFAWRLNEDGGGQSVANTSSVGHFAVRRSGASATAAFKNGASIGTGSVASVAPANRNWFVGSVNQGSASTFSTRQYAVSYGGASLTDQNFSDIYAALNTYLQAVGAA